jgi:uncharacterized membrane protein YccC
MTNAVGRNSLAKILARWERLLAGAEANREDLPALEHCRAQLEAALKDTKAARERRLSLQAEALQATQDLHALVRLGRDLAARLESGARLVYGMRSPKLAEFGMKALLPRTARAKPGSGCRVQGCPLEASATAK